MRKLIQKLTVMLPASLLISLSLAAPLALTSVASAQSTGSSCSKPTFFGLVPWYQYLQIGGSDCSVQNFTILGKGSSVLLIGLAILDDLVRVAALVAVIFVIVGGFKYITSQGSPEAAKEAQGTIIDALIGLVIAILAAGIVSFIGTKLGGS